MKKQIQNKRLVLFVFFYFLTIFFSYSANDALTFIDVGLASKNYNVKRNEDFSLTLAVFSKDEVSNLSSISITANFDKSKLSFKKAGLKDKSKGTTVKSTRSDGFVSLSYLNKGGINLNKESKIELVEIQFHTKARIEPGPTEILFELDGVCDKNNNPIDAKLNSQLVTLNIVPPDSSTCHLSSLSTSEGALKPEFSPNIYKYEINVSWNIKDVYLSFPKENLDATYKVNRHRLSAAGKSTDINVTICDTKEKSKLVYTITVNRAAKTTLQKKSKSKKSISNNHRSVPSAEVNSKGSAYDSGLKESFINSDSASKELNCDSTENEGENFYELGEIGEEDVETDDSYNSDDSDGSENLEDQKMEEGDPSEPDNNKDFKEVIHIEAPSEHITTNRKILLLCFIVSAALCCYSLYEMIISIKAIFNDSRINVKRFLYLD